MHTPHSFSALTLAQRDGFACVICEREDGPMRPVGMVDGGQVFACLPCTAAPAATSAVAPVLVVGPVNSPADVDSLRSFACDVATELGTPATYATHNEYRVTDFSAVYCLTPSASLHDRVGLLLVAEALVAGIPVHEPLSAAEAVECPCGLVCRRTRPDVVDGEPFCAECSGKSACAWCTEWNDTEDLEVVEIGETWLPLHPACVETVNAAIASAFRAPLAIAA